MEDQFVVPDATTREAAIGLEHVTENKKAYIPDDQFFYPIPEPGPWDWLSCHYAKEKKTNF